MKTTPVPSDSQGGIIDFLVADSTEALMWFANMGCVEFHPFHSTIAGLDLPTYAIFDFDPAEGSSWEQVTGAAKLLHLALGQLGLVGYPKLSGVARAPRLRASRPGAHPLSGPAFRRRGRGVSRRRQSRRHHDGMGQAEAEGKGLRRPQPQRLRADRGLGLLGPTPARCTGRRAVDVGGGGEVANGDFTIVDVWDRLQRYGDCSPR